MTKKTGSNKVNIEGAREFIIGSKYSFQDNLTSVSGRVSHLLQLCSDLLDEIEALRAQISETEKQDNPDKAMTVKDIERLRKNIEYESQSTDKNTKTGPISRGVAVQHDPEQSNRVAEKRQKERDKE